MRKSGAAAFPELLTGNGIIKDQVYHALREAILSADESPNDFGKNH
ncbi:hypothetical protein [Morganella morganii]|nr:hypothetical protein [Morganella morganii]NGE93202.1 hypothetical protein [Morganella morganii]